MTGRALWHTAAAVVAALGVIFVLADLGGGALNEMLLYLPGIDKVLHFAFSLVLFVVFERLLARTSMGPGARIAVAAAVAAGVAAADELQQRFAAGRSVELADVGAGLSGIAVAAAWRLRPSWPRAALALSACGVVAALWLTFDSHLQTRDYNRGLLAERSGDREAALEHYRAAVSRGVRNPEAYNALAWMMLETGKGDPHEAVQHAERSLAMKPDNPDALDTYGWALYRAGRAADAVKPLEQALADKPDIYCLHYHLGMAYLETGRREQGLIHLGQQVQVWPHTQEARLSAEVLTQLGVAAEVR